MAGGTRGTVRSLEDCVSRLEEQSQQLQAHIEQSKFHFDKADRNHHALQTMMEAFGRRMGLMDETADDAPSDRRGAYHAAADDLPPRRRAPDQRLHRVRRPPEHDYSESDEPHFPRRRHREADQRRPHATGGPASNFRIDIPRFNGEKPRVWIFQVDRYFRYYDYDDEQQLLIVSAHLDGPALSWFQWIDSTKPVQTWAELRDLVLDNFGPSPYRDLRGELCRLQQKGSVQLYWNDFQDLANQCPGVSESALQSYFESGLRVEIRREVRALQPTSLVQACQLAKLMEDRIADTDERVTTRATRLYSSQPALLPAPVREPRPAAPPGPTPVPFLRLTPAQMNERKAKGLCFNCPERFQRGHVCRPQAFMIIMANEEYETESPPLTPEETEPSPSPPDLEISFNAYTGLTHPRTFRLMGRLGNANIHVLVDSGSTHNFLQPKWARYISQPATPTRTFEVMVGNGERLPCTGKYDQQLPVMLQGFECRIDCFLLPIHGADLVLGVQWLQQLGPSTTDYVAMTMAFHQAGQQVVLTSQSTVPYAPVSSFHFLHLGPHDNTMSCWLFCSPTEQVTTSTSVDSEWHSILAKFSSVFQIPRHLPPIRDIDHRIQLVDGTAPIKVRPYRYPYYQKGEIERLVADMLETGIIRPSTSAFSSPVLLVKKKDGSWRFCVDYRALNKATVADQFPMPTIDELMDELHGSVIYSRMDLHAGYHQIRMFPADIHKTAFRTHDGHFEFTVMPFGLMNAPSTFQHMMNTILRPFLRRFVLVFFDDILVYSRTRELHAEHLSQVLELLSQNQLYLKLPKCIFGCDAVHYLGHIVSAAGCAVDPDKIAAIQGWPIPRTVKQLRSFLGLAGYYRKFVRDFARLAQPLTALLAKDGFKWSESTTHAFQQLQQALTALPVLAFPDFQTDFILETDASSMAIGAVLIQHKRPLAFFSRQLPPPLKKASTYARELYAITESVAKWRQYLLGRAFVIRTDHKSIKELVQQTIQTPEQQRFLIKLLGFRFRIEYNPGKANTVADALSRRVEDSVLADTPANAPVEFLLTAISRHSTAMLDMVLNAQRSDSIIQDLMHKAATDSTSMQDYSIRGGLLLYQNRICIPEDLPLRRQLLTEFHDTPVGGHGGIKRTMARLAAQFHWPHLRRDVQAFVNTCAICQATKSEPKKPGGLLQPLPVPSDIWSELTMDFIVGLPKSQGKSVILVVVDRLSKYAHFIAMAKRFTASSVAQSFVAEICRLHGMPRSIISDRDPIFMSSFWQALFKFSGTTLKHSSSYHPETDGQSEITNKGVEQYLRSFCMDNVSSWVKFLPWAEYSYNTATHTATKMTPFLAVYGRHPPPLLDYTGSETSNAAAHTLLVDRTILLKALHDNLTEANNRTKQLTDKGRREVIFDIGDRVLVRLQPYRQTSVNDSRFSKLQRRFFGPFAVLKRIGEVAYKLDLPDTSRIHPVFHVSKLKRFREDSNLHPVPILPPAMDGKVVVQPLDIIRQRWVVGRERDDLLVLVTWAGLPAEEATWMPVQELADAYPHFDLEGKVNVEHGGDVMSRNPVYVRRTHWPRNTGLEETDVHSTASHDTIVSDEVETGQISATLRLEHRLELEHGTETTPGVAIEERPATEQGSETAHGFGQVIDF